MHRHDSVRTSRGTGFQRAAAVIVTLLCGLAPLRAQRPPAGVPLVLDGVTVIDVQNGTRVPGQRVVVVGNRIRAVGRANGVRVPAGARVVDARGKYLIPGLWDMHVHMRHAVDAVYPLLLANGVTGFRDPGSDVPLDTLRLWRRETLAGTRVGPPRQVFAGPFLNSRSQCVNQKSWGSICVSDDPVKVVDSLKAAGADMIKMYILWKKDYFAIAAEARRVGLAFGGHIQGGLGISTTEASDSGVRILDHLDAVAELCLKPEASLARCRLLSEKFRKNGTWVVPTFIVYAVASSPAPNRPPDAIGELGKRWGVPKLLSGPSASSVITRLFKLRNEFWAGSNAYRTWLIDSAGPVRALGGDSASLSVFRQAGVPLMAGTDVLVLERHLPGFSLHAELALLVAEGLTPLEALRTATLNPAKMLHATDSLGTVAAGKLADLVLLDADPLVDIANTTAIRAVVGNGRYFDRAALDRLLADVQSKGDPTQAPSSAPGK